MSEYYDYRAKLTLTTLVKRHRTLPNPGGRTLHFHLRGFGKSGRFLRPEEVPDFKGEEAEFEYEKVGRQVRLLRLVRATKP